MLRQEPNVRTMAGLGRVIYPQKEEDNDYTIPSPASKSRNIYLPSFHFLSPFLFGSEHDEIFDFSFFS
jgi:hypothetical protein